MPPENKKMKYKIEKILDMNLRGMKPYEKIEIKVKQLFDISDTLIVYGFKVGFGLSTIMFLIGLIFDRWFL